MIEKIECVRFMARMPSTGIEPETFTAENEENSIFHFLERGVYTAHTKRLINSEVKMWFSAASTSRFDWEIPLQRMSGLARAKNGRKKSC